MFLKLLNNGVYRLIQYTFIIPTITISNIFIKALDNLVNQNFEHKYEIIVIIDNINLPIAEGIKISTVKK